jgi:predicted nucleotidyltransferase
MNYEIYLVKKIGVFGSFAHGEETESSDLDILVEFSSTVGLFHFSKLRDIFPV